ncbi:hypothetical protein NliqN6_6193 [Naganishia liquefaciens]|uniref:AMP-binding protein n=1 Tax=Naganishia liquefaciens TaxID=104408 RepID=A0A8H3TY73_9TREE|nr:hypothetical protein NliqN6_6193 [Naganishia liquefaciens]
MSHLTLPALFTALSPSHADPNATAVIIPGPNAQSISYPSLATHVAAFARQLAHIGVRGGDVVSMSLINSLEFTAGFFATTSLRGVSAPLNPAYSQAEVEFYLQDTQSAVLLVAADTTLDAPAVKAGRACGVMVVKVVNRRNGASVEDVKLEVMVERTQRSGGKQQGQGMVANANQADGSNQVLEQDVALVLHTSGTTGRPKAVPLTHLNLLTTMRNICNTYEFTPADRGLLVMPLFHVHGLVCGLLAPLLAGSSVVIPPKFSAHTFWRDYTTHHCTWYTAVPTIHSILLATPLPSPIPNIRFIRSCSSSLSPTVFHRLEETFHAPVLEAYAMSEAAHAMCGSPLPHNGPRYPGSVGKPQGVELTIRAPEDGRAVTAPGERGEVCIRGKNVMLGYVNNEKANKEGYWPGENGRGAEARWFRTGDEGYLTQEGYLVLTGRLKELINRGGEKISPIELDSALLALDGVAEAVAFGVEDAKYGEKVWAAVVPKSGAKVDEESLKRALAGKVAKFKIPERIIFTPAIPKTATGKIQRRHVRDKFVKDEADKAKKARQAKL